MTAHSPPVRCAAAQRQGGALALATTSNQAPAAHLRGGLARCGQDSRDDGRPAMPEVAQ